MKIWGTLFSDTSFCIRVHVTEEDDQREAAHSFFFGEFQIVETRTATSCTSWLMKVLRRARRGCADSRGFSPFLGKACLSARARMGRMGKGRTARARKVKMARMERAGSSSSFPSRVFWHVQLLYLLGLVIINLKYIFTYEHLCTMQGHHIVPYSVLDLSNNHPSPSPLSTILEPRVQLPLGPCATVPRSEEAGHGMEKTITIGRSI